MVDEAEQVRALEAERASGVGAVAAVVAERRLDELALEVDERGAIARVLHRVLVTGN